MKQVNRDVITYYLVFRNTVGTHSRVTAGEYHSPQNPDKEFWRAGVVIILTGQEFPLGSLAR